MDCKSLQEYAVNVGVPQGSILGPTLFLLYIKNLCNDGICNIAIYADDTTLYSKRGQAFDLWQQLNCLLILNLIYKRLWTGSSTKWTNLVQFYDGNKQNLRSH